MPDNEGMVGVGVERREVEEEKKEADKHTVTVVV